MDATPNTVSADSTEKDDGKLPNYSPRKSHHQTELNNANNTVTPNQMESKICSRIPTLYPQTSLGAVKKAFPTSKITKKPNSMKPTDMCSSKIIPMSETNFAKRDITNTSPFQCTSFDRDSASESPPSMRSISNAEETVNFLKEEIQNDMDRSYRYLEDNLKDIKGCFYWKKIEDHQYNMLESVNDFAHALVKMYDKEVISRITKIEKEFQTSKEELKQAEKRLIGLQKAQEEALQKELMETEASASQGFNELNEMCEKLKALKKEQEMLEATLPKRKESTSSELNVDSQMNEKLGTKKETDLAVLTEAETEINNRKKLEIVTSQNCQKLEHELNETRKKLEEANIKIEVDSTARRELDQEIFELRKCIEGLEGDKCSVEKKLIQLQQDYDSLKLLQDEKQKCVLQEGGKSIGELNKSPREYQNEIKNLQKLLNEERQVTTDLKAQLASARLEIRRHVEHAQRDAQLLQVRCDLINTLQMRESTLKDHLAAMRREIKENDKVIEGLDKELQTKATESSLQLRVIEQLEQNNELLHVSGVRQCERICRLEAEIAQLEAAIDISETERSN